MENTADTLLKQEAQEQRPLLTGLQLTNKEKPESKGHFYI